MSYPHLRGDHEVLTLRIDGGSGDYINVRLSTPKNGIRISLWDPATDTLLRVDRDSTVVRLGKLPNKTLEVRVTTKGSFSEVSEVEVNTISDASVALVDDISEVDMSIFSGARRLDLRLARFTEGEWDSSLLPSRKGLDLLRIRPAPGWDGVSRVPLSAVEPSMNDGSEIYLKSVAKGDLRDVADVDYDVLEAHSTKVEGDLSDIPASARNVSLDATNVEIDFADLPSGSELRSLRPPTNKKTGAEDDLGYILTNKAPNLYTLRNRNLTVTCDPGDLPDINGEDLNGNPYSGRTEGRFRVLGASSVGNDDSNIDDFRRVPALSELNIANSLMYGNLNDLGADRPGDPFKELGGLILRQATFRGEGDLDTLPSMPIYARFAITSMDLSGSISDYINKLDTDNGYIPNSVIIKEAEITGKLDELNGMPSNLVRFFNVDILRCITEASSTLFDSSPKKGYTNTRDYSKPPTRGFTRSSPDGDGSDSTTNTWGAELDKLYNALHDQAKKGNLPKGITVNTICSDSNGDRYDKSTLYDAETIDQIDYLKNDYGITVKA